MSAGIFIRSFYQASYAALVHPIRVQPETALASIGGTTNAPPAGPASNKISARSSGGKRSLGLVARRVTIEAPAVSPPAGYKPSGKTTIPALNIAFFNAAIKGSTCTYLGATFIVVSQTSEVAQ